MPARGVPKGLVVCETSNLGDVDVSALSFVIGLKHRINLIDINYLFSSTLLPNMYRYNLARTRRI